MVEQKENSVAKATASKAKAASKTSAEAKKVSASTASKKSAAVKKTPVKKTYSGATVTIKMTGSPIRRDSRQREYLKGLGLKKINQTRELMDTPEIRGLIAKAHHMVEIVA